MNLSFADILNALREKFGEGYYHFKVRDGRLVGAKILQDERHDPMDDTHLSNIGKIKVDEREMAPRFVGYSPVEVIRDDLTEWGIQKKTPIL